MCDVYIWGESVVSHAQTVVVSTGSSRYCHRIVTVRLWEYTRVRTGSGG